MEVTEHKVDTTDDFPTPGVQLRTAREKAGLQVNDVSKQLYISTPKISALENDQYEKLPSPIFVQGYIRQYAKLLNLDEESLLKCYSDYLQQLQTTMEQVMPEKEEPELVVFIPPKWLVPAVLSSAAVVVLALIFIFSSEEEMPPAPAATEQVDVEPASRMQNPTVQETFTTEASPSDPVQQSATANNELTEESQIVDLQQSDAQATVTEGATQTPPSQVAESSNETVVASTIATGDMDTLTFGFVGECWVEVEDANGERIAADLLNAGEPLVVRGEAPFAIMLGNAEAVSLSLNDEPIDIDIRPGRRTARLVVGE